MSFLMKRLWLRDKTCHIFKDTAVNRGIIFSNLTQRKSSRWRNSQNLVVTYCSGPFAPLYHELTLNKSNQREENLSITSEASCLSGQGERSSSSEGTHQARGWAGGTSSRTRQRACGVRARVSGATWCTSTADEAFCPRSSSPAQAHH